MNLEMEDTFLAQYGLDLNSFNATLANPTEGKKY